MEMEVIRMASAQEEKVEMKQKPKISQKDLFRMAITGAITATGYADVLLNRAIRKHGPDKEINYPDTGYELPSFFAWTDRPVKKLGDLPALLGKVRAKIDHEPTFENALIAGEATMWSAEIVEALKYIDNEDPYGYVSPENEPVARMTPNLEGLPGYCGFVPDRILRKLGIAFVDDTIPGTMVFVGKAKDPKALAKVIRGCQNKGMLIFATFDIIKQLHDENIAMGWEVMLYPVGEFTQVIHGLNFAIRASLSYGGRQRGDRQGVYDYLKKRPKVVVIQLGPLDQVKVAAEFAVMFNGSPTITDQDVEEIPGRYVVQKDYDQIISTAIEIRDMRVKLGEVPIPVAYGPAFEGESIRRPETYIEAGGAAKTLAFELVKMVDADKVEDGKITFIGKDVDEMKKGDSFSICTIVEVYGPKMQEDFEPVLERRIHQFTNFINGGWHTGQRNLAWIRLSDNAVAQGLKLKHFGDVLYYKLHQEFEGVVTRVQVTIITDEEEAKKHLPEALEKYEKRDERVRGLTDEAVDTYYTCTLCQSFAPNHVCIISPERLGLCGAINWMDAKAAYEITPTGPNRPIEKGPAIDERIGQWENTNKAVFEFSHGAVERMSQYTMMVDPMTSCGCFECIVGIIPECNGVIVVNREHGGMTPIGMKFSTLAGSVGGGLQTPGFIGVGRQFLVSKKFIRADGGMFRIVWMPKELKEAMREQMTERAKELGDPDFVDKIADETITTDPIELLEYLQKMDHPALKMESMI
jgi:acetyl-CoA synthase